VVHRRSIRARMACTCMHGRPPWPWCSTCIFAALVCARRRHGCWLIPAPRWSRSRRRAGSLATLASAAGPRAGRAHMRSLAGAAAARPHSLALAAPLCKCRVKSDVCVAASANAGRDFLRPLRSAARLAPAPLGRACLRPLQSATQLAPALPAHAGPARPCRRVRSGRAAVQQAAPAALAVTKAASPSHKLPLPQGSELLPRTVVAWPLPRRRSPWRGGNRPQDTRPSMARRRSRGVLRGEFVVAWPLGSKALSVASSWSPGPLAPRRSPWRGRALWSSVQARSEQMCSGSNRKTMDLGERVIKK
jgi:hypothetical protein